MSTNASNHRLVSTTGRLARKYLPPKVKRVGRAVIEAMKTPAPVKPEPVIQVDPTPDPPAAPSIRLLHTAEEVTDFVAELNKFAGDDYPHFLQLVNSAQFVMPQPVPQDPLSVEYRDYQLDLWRLVSGRDVYDPALCEADTDVTVEAGLRLPFPHVTRDSTTVGNYFLLLGWILRNLECGPGSRVVEFGAGWGHVTDAFARSGFDVTVVDIEKTFLDLIESRCERDGLHVATHHGTFDSLPASTGPFDIAVFSECFHHALDHIAVIRLLSEIVRPGGRVLFAAEPISDSSPVPWGLRLDGHALWATRNFGWMELGFSETYMRGLLDLHGFDFERRDLDGIGAFGSLVIATHRSG